MGAIIGNQTVIPIAVAPPGYAMGQALIYYPDDYFLPANANKRYPLYVFLHGAGEGTKTDITEVTNTSLPNLIKNGLKPYGIDPVTLDTIKYIIVSPHCALCGGSYSYPQLQYTIPALFTAYRVDTSCVWVGGLSSGGRGTWSVVMGQNVGDTVLGKRITGIMPMANGGYDNNIGTLAPNLDTIARRGLGCLYVIGDQDPGYNSIGFFAYQALMKKYSQPGRYFDSVIIGGTHSTNVWNTPFPLTARDWSKTMNSWTQMWTMRKTAVTSTPPPTSNPPTVSAGGSQTIALPSPLTLTGTATPVGGTTIASYLWSQVSGPNTANITSTGALSTTVNGLAAGTYVFKLLVTASDGSTATSTVQIIVNAATPANVPPVASAGTAQTVTLPTSTATLTGSGTDSDGSIAGYAWTQVSGPNTAGITAATSASTTVTGLVQGAYVFRLTVTDDKGATGTADVTVTVNAAAPANVPPVASAGTAQTVTLPTSTATLTGSGTDSDGSIAGYAWTQVSGPNTAGITAATSASTTVTGLAQGAYVFRLTVTDDKGATGTADVTVTVNAATSTPPAGTVVVKVGCSEYKAAWLYSDGVARSFVYNTTTGHVEFMPYLINGRKAVDISTGFNVITLLDDQGYVWLGDKGKNTATRWDKDAYGNAFNGNVSIYGYFFTYLSIRNDGSIWYWGGDDYKFYGGAVAAPVKLHTPAGVKFTKISTGNALMALSTTGDVYYWDKGDSNYTKIPLPRPATDIAASHMGYYIVVVPDDITVSKMGWPYAFGPESKYWGSQVPAAPTAPVSIKALWNMTYPIREINANQNSIHYIDSQGDMYGLGDNANGEVGNGEELVNHTEKYATPYAWNWGKYGWMIGTPTQILPGTKWKHLFTGNTFVFYNYASDVNDSLYFWGRNKSFVGGDGVVNNQEGTWPNALDVLKPTLRTPIAVTPLQTTAYDFTPYTLKTPAKQTIITTSAVLSATATASVLKAAGKPDYGYTIVKYQWAQISGPNTATITSPNVLSTTATGLTTGTYIFSIQTTDNNTGTITSYDTIIVNNVGTGVPVANAGPDQTITLPTSSVTLTGTGQENGGTIVGYKWVQLTGPNTSTIAGATSASTGVSGLVAGTYTFQLTVTDNSGKTATAVVTITVKPAVAPGPPSANAGVDQTITLPTSSVTLTGSGSETNGTIVSYKWTQVSGPNTATIANANAASTGVSGLVAGSYVFQLTVTDNSNVTATDAMTVTVKPAIVPGPPSANAGANQTITLPTSSVTLSGSGSETNGTIVSYKWTQVSGPNTATIANANAASTGVSGLIQGIYVFQLTVTDNSNVTASDAVTVTVNPAVVTPGTPVVDAGVNQTITLPTNSVTLTGTASETGGTIVSYKWTQISGPNTANIVNNAQASTGVDGLVQGVYTFQLTVTDNSNVTASGVVKVTVNPAAVPGTPTVDAGPDQTITLPTSSVTLTGTASETNGTIVSYKWTQVSGPNTAAIANDAQASTGVSGLVQGTYIFQLTVTDNSNVTASAVIKITVNSAGANQPPVAVPGPNLNISSSVGSVPLDGSHSYDPDGTIVKYQWLQISGAGGVTITGSNTATPMIYGLEPGVYVFQLTVTDNQGATDSKTMTITVTDGGNQAPVADAGRDTTLLFPGQTSTLLDGRASSDPGGTIASYSWQQLSGPSGAVIENTSGNFTGVNGLIVGEYTFQLTVTDSKNVKATATVRVRVLSDLRNNGFVKIYPNPVPMDQAMTVEGSTDSASVMKFTIYDVQGRVVRQTMYSSQFSMFKTTLQTAGLGKGFYVLTVQFNGGGKPQSYKFIID
ncbi:MAG: T9SS type A sorting domain-containing protein [Chitinophagaceae bacterium]|nr:T9SS type A sorting domain-containing protein [Chitinophagaceae bacterium]